MTAPKQTNPIKPASQPTNTAAARTQPPTPKTNPTQPPASGGSASPPNTAVSEGRSPIQEQHRDPKIGDYQNCLNIIFLTGVYKGQKIELGGRGWLGIGISESNHQISAQWSERDEKGIRGSLNFDKLGSRTFSISVEFFDTKHDISHLVENLACLQQIGGDKLAGQTNPTPPLLSLQQGNLKARPVVCTQINPKYSEAHSGSLRGFRRAVVELQFQLMGGKDSEHALGKPLAATPLTDWLSSNSEIDRERQGTAAIATELLAECLGAVGNQQLKALLDSGKMAEPEALEALDDGLFAQLAIGGVIRSELMREGRLSQKLGRSLASSMAMSESGVVRTGLNRQFAHSLETGDTSNLPQDLREQATAARSAYQQIMKSIQAGDLSDSLDHVSNPDSANRLRNFGRCGLSFRQIGAAIASTPQSSEAAIAQSMKEFLGSSPPPSSQAIKDRFGLQTDAQIKQLLNGHPYSSKAQFVSHMGQMDKGMDATAMWNRFGST